MIRMRFVLSWDGREAVIRPWSFWRGRVAAGGEDFNISPGAMIVLSTDVNAEREKGWKGKLSSIIKTLYNRMMKSWLTKDVMDPMFEKRGMDSGWSIGNLFRGRYFDQKTGKVYNEKSFAIDVRGVELDFMEDVAGQLGKKFKQRSVLLIDNSTGRGKFVETGYGGKEEKSVSAALADEDMSGVGMARELLVLARELVGTI